MVYAFRAYEVVSNRHKIKLRKADLQLVII